MGQGQAQGTAMDRTEFLNLLTEIRGQIIQKQIEHKDKAVKERLQYFKKDMEQYKQTIISSMQSQMMEIQTCLMEILKQKNITESTFQASLQSYMQDPECLEAFQKMQMAPMEMLSKVEIPPELTEEKLIEVINFITETWKGMPDTQDMTQGLVLQAAGFDESYEKFQFYEMQIGAALNKYEESTNAELIKAREE